MLLSAVRDADEQMSNGTFCSAALQCQSRAKKGVICQTLQEAKQ